MHVDEICKQWEVTELDFVSDGSTIEKILYQKQWSKFNSQKMYYNDDDGDFVKEMKWRKVKNSL